MENFHTTHRVSNNPAKGERHYIVLDGLSKPNAETLIALILDIPKTGGKTAVKGIREETWREVIRSMEVFDGVPAFRLPSGATEADAKKVLSNVRDRFQLLMQTDQHMLDNMGQRHAAQ